MLPPPIRWNAQPLTRIRVEATTVVMGIFFEAVDVAVDVVVDEATVAEEVVVVVGIRIQSL